MARNVDVRDLRMLLAMLKTPIELDYSSFSFGFGSNAISSGVKSLVIVSPVMTSWNVPCGFDVAMIYAFRYP